MPTAFLAASPAAAVVAETYSAAAAASQLESNAVVAFESTPLFLSALDITGIMM